MKTVIMSLGFLLMTLNAEARTLRATELDNKAVASLLGGSAEPVVIEFRAGDEIPVSFGAEGDLLETTRAGQSYVGVKRNFWLRIEGMKFEMSLDGIAYKPLSEMISGSLFAGANAGSDGGAVNGINVGLKAKLK